MPGKSKTPANQQTNKPANIIAIDGPAGSGKSTVAKELAKRLGYLYIDTGAMYRALTLKAIRDKVELKDAGALVELARQAKIRLKTESGNLKVTLAGKDVSRAIRQPSVTQKVCHIAKVPGVRKEMVKLQRRLAQDAVGAVLEGRDIGTVVFPEAGYKFYLDAQGQIRIERRFKELQQMGQKVSRAEVARDIHGRDKTDLTREVAPLKKAQDAILIDTTELGVEEVVTKIIACITTELRKN